MQGTPPARSYASRFAGASGPAFWQTISAAILKALPEALSLLSMPVERYFVKGNLFWPSGNKDAHPIM
jgi:hypothetical protein